MEHFIVSARKYRPQTFKDVVGQQAITNTLLNAIENNHLAQALLFTGPRGVGKTSCARILAKTINQDGNEHPDEDFAFNIFELDAASNNSVDDIRSLIDQVRIPPQVGKYKVYIIDEVHMLSQAAFNAFLKTLEEPPKHAIFILATTEKHKIIPTILSRCQIFDFKRITVTDAKNHLMQVAVQEGITADEDALQIIAQKADGAMRDALSIFDRVVSFSGKNLTRQAVTENLNVLDYETYFKTTDLILENNIPQLLIEFNEILAQGFDGHHFVSGLASHFRDLLVCKNQATINLLEVGQQTKTKYLEQSQKAPHGFLIKGIEIANDCDLKYKTSRNQRLLVELCLMQLASILVDGEKKNDKPYIIPPSYFKEKGIKPVKISSEIKEKVLEKTETEKQNSTPPQTEEKPEPSTTPVSEVSQDKDTEPHIQEENSEDTITAEAPVVEKKSVLINKKRKTSGLSLSSIKRKKEHEESKEEQVIDPENLPKEEFTESQMQEGWIEYGKMQDKKGERIIGSMFAMNIPTLDKGYISLELPNQSMKIDMEAAQSGLLQFLFKKLKNYSIEMKITVNEEASKKYAFTPQDKYEKLREKNPLIDKLRSSFDLDI
ncbi:DNA polymerase-3 subunit gamma/tau [Aquimarina sp. EL_43]|uniref:DNA polymerase III subunit gamma/tau n=1 Tax=unclassified Aquimarina TaxID=2627091 RepID=UPI0018CA4402|nr:MULTISPECIES: DNA polymerase III subunit gamma/tau [unclassified Aquimarina]MBG6129723.1 DNA polymerase-3 subunit gamma/tau [Aquimarina sp. EL_35]MBG6150788.1 DNA polymerase-3 subunit gamma/tau [Aquimarina sp. EL_32]MBG6167905.1 DNA polymerase-3 subunit gamma/tau [Aquimarina sp. EL_43]